MCRHRARGCVCTVGGSSWRGWKKRVGPSKPRKDPAGARHWDTTCHETNTWEAGLSLPRLGARRLGRDVLGRWRARPEREELDREPGCARPGSPRPRRPRCWSLLPPCSPQLHRHCNLRRPIDSVRGPWPGNPGRTVLSRGCADPLAAPETSLPLSPRPQLASFCKTESPVPALAWASALRLSQYC